MFNRYSNAMKFNFKVTFFDVYMKCQNSAHNLNSCLLTQNTATMSFTYNGIELDDLKTLWPVIWPKLSSEASAKIKPFVEKLFTTGNDEQIANWTDVVQSCCEHKPTTFEEYIAYAMIALSIELLPVPSTQFRLEKSRLIAHTFNTFNDFWAHDQKQVSWHFIAFLVFLLLLRPVSRVTWFQKKKKFFQWIIKSHHFRF